MNNSNSQLLGGLLLAMCLVPSVHAGPILDALHKEAKPVDEQATTAAKPAAPAKPAAEVKPATMKDAFGSAVEISNEVKLIDKRLEALERSVAAISNSLEPVGKLARPEGLRALMVEGGDMAYDRARSLIFLATGCAAALILGLAALWHWVTPARKS